MVIGITIILMILSFILGLICSFAFEINEVLEKEKLSLNISKKIDVILKIIFSKNLFEVFKPYRTTQINKIIKDLVICQTMLKEKNKNSKLVNEYSEVLNEKFPLVGSILLDIIPNIIIEEKYSNYFQQKILIEEENKSYHSLKDFSFKLQKRGV